MDAVPPPDPTRTASWSSSDPGDRIHFLDWGGPTADPGVLLIHGLSNTAWTWAPVARRLVVRRHVVAMDLRGHGLSDAPTEAYAPADLLAEDVVAVAEGSGLLAAAGSDAVVLAGHGFGASSRPGPPTALGDRCAGLVLVDGGWEDLEAATRHRRRRVPARPRRAARGHAVARRAFLADRAAFDPPTLGCRPGRAARATVVETHAGQVVPATRPHALEACVRTMFAYDPERTLAGRRCAGDRADRGRRRDRLRARALASADAPPAPRPAARRSGRVSFGRRRPQPDALPSGRGHRGDPEVAGRG